MKYQNSMMTASKVFKILLRVLTVLCFVGAAIFLASVFIVRAVPDFFGESGGSTVYYLNEFLGTLSMAVTYLFATRYCSAVLSEESAFTQKANKALFRLGIATPVLALAAFLAETVVCLATKSGEKADPLNIDLIVAGLCMVALSTAFSLQPIEKTAKSLKIVFSLFLALCSVSAVVFTVSAAVVQKAPDSSFVRFVLGNNDFSQAQLTAKAVLGVVLYLLSSGILFFAVKYLSQAVLQKTIFTEKSADNLLLLSIAMLIVTGVGFGVSAIVRYRFGIMGKDALISNFGMAATGECLFAFSFVVKWKLRLDGQSENEKIEEENA